MALDAAQNGEFPALNALARFALSHYDGLPMSYFPEVAAPRVWARVKEILPLVNLPMRPLARESEFFVDELMHANAYSNCALCGEGMAEMDDSMQYPCPDAHQFHTTCMKQVDAHKCPICLYEPSNYDILESEMAMMAPRYAQLLVHESTNAVYTPEKNAGPMMALKRLLESGDWQKFKPKTLNEIEAWYANQAHS